MRLTTEEKQYLEIYLWNDYNEKIVLKKEDLKTQNNSQGYLKIRKNRFLRKYPKSIIN